MSLGSYSYRVQRPDHDRLVGRDAYLAAKARQISLREFRRFCHALSVSSLGGAPGPAPYKSYRPTPWLMLVLGSGCAELPDTPGFTADLVAEGVREAIRALGRDWPDNGDDSWPSQAATFARSLVHDRLPIPDREFDERDLMPESDGDPLPIEPIAAHMVLVATMLTKVFHTALGLAPLAMSRWDDDEAWFDVDRNPEIQRDLVEPLIREINAATKLISRYPDLTNTANHVRGLLETILLDLSPPGQRRGCIRIYRLRLVTEIAWFLLVRGTSVYPGWSDILLRLVLREDADIATRRRPRPRYRNLRELQATVAELMQPVTGQSWTSHDPNGRPQTDRDRLYASAAEVLWAEADALTCDGIGTTLPPAAAFVTAFDLELEMALWAKAEGRTFFVGLPVHLASGPEADEAELCWLLGEVHPDPDPDLLWDKQLTRLQTPCNWRLLTPKSDPEQLRKGPIVIHLSGSPLFKLPRLEDPSSDDLLKDLADVMLTVDRDVAVLSHAVTVDEYVAFRQSEAEMFWASTNAKDRKARSGRSLHPDLLDDENNRRFWMVIGVPIIDPAIRHRVVTQMTMRMARGVNGAQVEPFPGTGLGDPRTRRSLRKADIEGVAINKRVTDDEASILYWVGLDVVIADCRAFQQDLHHYAAHLSLQMPMSPSVECSIPSQ